jgi:hypothetical protein
VLLEARGWGGERREDLGAIYRKLEAVRGENISPAVGLAGGGGVRVPAGLPTVMAAPGDVTAQAAVGQLAQVTGRLGVAVDG